VGRPEQLSRQFVKLLNEAEGRHRGYFQIVEFHQKKNKYYSTHIADGYYKCKVIFRDRANKQLDNGEIKLFSVLYGTVTNQGQRVLMVFDAMQVWEYPRTIGVVRSWRNETANTYINGSNFINWNQDAADLRLDDSEGSQDPEDSTVTHPTDTENTDSLPLDNI
jgi:hypothetical protein